MPEMKTLAEMHEELRELAMKEPIVYGFMMHQQLQGVPQEQMLIGMVLALAEKCGNLEKQYIDHLNRCTTPRISLNGDTHD